jgi:hypothetical protein
MLTDSISEHAEKTKCVANVTVLVDKADVDWRVRRNHGYAFYRVHYRVRTEWEGMCEKWRFFISRDNSPIPTAQDETGALCATLELFDAPPPVLMEGKSLPEMLTLRALRSQK